MTEDADPRQRIVLAAIDLLNREGLEAITTRRISEAAGVNVAAVNYYFGTKDNLVKQTLSLTLSHAAEDWETVMSDHRIPTPLRFHLGRDTGLSRSRKIPPVRRLDRLHEQVAVLGEAFRHTGRARGSA
jgi:AcrR family transcriptional regulator